LNSLSNTNQKSNLIWKPKPGKQVVRIVPYKYVPENPFMELKFHYNINGKTYLSPDSFGRPDPIVEFSNRLKKTGDKEDWKMGRKMEPKMRTFAPVIVRGEEHEGVKFWGFGKQVYQELLSIISDPDFGDITDLTSGRDIVVEFKTGDESGKSFPETNIRVKPNTSIAVDPKNTQLLEALKSQVNILDLFPEFSYDELKDVMDKWLNPDIAETSSAVLELQRGLHMDKWLNPDTAETTETPVVSADDDDVPAQPAAAPAASKPAASPSAVKAKSAATDDVTAAFDDLFNS
jgi:hypothetical protein